MRLLDTCVWIEAIIGSATSERMQAMLLDKQNLLVPTLVQLELRR